MIVVGNELKPDMNVQQNLQAIRRQKELDRQKALENKKAIQEQHRKVKERLKKEREAKIRAVKQQVQARIEREERESAAKLHAIDDMEKEELRLIELLQKTQHMQKDAYDGLEKALNEQDAVMARKASHEDEVHVVKRSATSEGLKGNVVAK